MNWGCPFPTIEPNLCCPYIHGCGAFRWGMFSLWMATFLKKIDCHSYSNYQLPIASGVGQHVYLLYAGIWSCMNLPGAFACCHNCREFISATALLSPEDAAPLVFIHNFWLLQYFCPLFCSEPWALEGEHPVEMLHLGYLCWSSPPAKRSSSDVRADDVFSSEYRNKSLEVSLALHPCSTPVAVDSPLGPVASLVRMLPGVGFCCGL